MNNTINAVEAELGRVIKQSEDAGYPVKCACTLIHINPGELEDVEIGFIANPVLENLKRKMDASDILVIAMNDGNVMLIEEPMNKSKPFNDIATIAIKEHSPLGVLDIKVHGTVLCLGADSYRGMFITDMDMIKWVAEAKADEVVERCERTGEDISEVSLEIIKKLIGDMS